jgi:hypothetical protein
VDDSDPQRRLQAVETLGHAGEAFGDGDPVRFRGAGHTVEHAAHFGDGRADDAHAAVRVAGVVELHFDLEALDHDVAGDAVALRGGVDLGQIEQRAAGEFGARLDAGGGVVGEFGIVAGEARLGGEHRIEGGELFDVGI